MEKILEIHTALEAVYSKYDRLIASLQLQLDSGTEYLLFDGSSPDGRGDPKFVGRTRDKIAAMEHHLECRANPYSCGKVMTLNEHEFKEFETWHA